MALIKCPDCKKTVSDKAKKCPHCGLVMKKDVTKEISTKSKNIFNKSVDLLKKGITYVKEHKKKSICVFVGLIAIILIIYILFFKPDVYKLSDIYDIKVTGIDGYAKVELTLKEEMKETSFDAILDVAEIEIPNNGSLKNGDKVEIVIKNIDEELAKSNKLKIKDTYSITIDKLKTGEVLDLFESMKITYSNKSPYLKLSITNDKLDVDKYNIVYTVTSLDTEKSNYYIKNGFYKNDEKIKITVSYNNDELIKAGYLVNKTEYEMTISDQDAYFISKEQVTDEMKKVVEEAMIKKVKEYATAAQMKTLYCRAHYCSSCSKYYCTDAIRESSKESNYEVSKVETVALHLGIKESKQAGGWADETVHTAMIGQFKLTLAKKEDPIYCGVNFDNMYLEKNSTLSKYEISEDAVECSGFSSLITKESNLQNSGKYQYTDTIKLSE